MSIIRNACVAAAAFGALVGATAPAMADGDIFQAVYRVKLTDPETGASYFVDRRSLRSWTSKEDCERERGSFSGYHTDRVRSFEIRTGEGDMLTVKMDAMFCVPQG